MRHTRHLISTKLAHIHSNKSFFRQTEMMMVLYTHTHTCASISHRINEKKKKKKNNENRCSLLTENIFFCIEIQLRVSIAFSTLPEIRTFNSLSLALSICIT